MSQNESPPFHIHCKLCGDLPPVHQTTACKAQITLFRTSLTGHGENSNLTEKMPHPNAQPPTTAVSDTIMDEGPKNDAKNEQPITQGPPTANGSAPSHSYLATGHYEDETNQEGDTGTNWFTTALDTLVNRWKEK